MKERIIEIVEFGHPQSLIQRVNAPITELIKTDMLIEELNEQLRLFSNNKSFHCQSEIEDNGKCNNQCEHCKEYYKPLIK